MDGPLGRPAAHNYLQYLWRRASPHEEALPQAKIAQAQGHGEDREGVVAVPVDRLLVFVAKSRHQDLIDAKSNFTSPYGPLS